MHFEHLVEINGDETPPALWLSRDQLWRGLLQRAEHPEASVVGLDACRIVERGDDYILRELHYGTRLIRDRVTFSAGVSVCYENEAAEDVPARRLTMRIEEPFSERLFVRFTYADLSAATPAPTLYDDFLKQAYLEADIDTITRIRQLAVEGRLEGPGEIH